MRILYGVQGTGNGHLARARPFAPALLRAGHEVDWLFSGREPSAYFDMDAFGAARHFRGLGLVVRNGRIDRLATARRIRPLRLARELRDVRPVLTRPLPGQHEQQANALALRALGLGRVHRGALNPVLAERFAAEPRGARARPWPDVAGAVVQALDAGPGLDAEALSARLWRAAVGLARHAPFDGASSGGNTAGAPSRAHPVLPSKEAA